MKILLISPLIAPQRVPSLHNIGLSYIAAVLRKEGHTVEMLDIEGYRYSEEEVRERVKKSDCEAIGIGTLITGYTYVKWLISGIRNWKPGVPIILGNSIVSTLPKSLLLDLGFDIGVMGEGEVTILEVLKALKNGLPLENVKGICFKKDGAFRYTPDRELIQDLDSLPMPAWDLFPIRKIYSKARANRLLPLPTGYVSTTRGCPYQCTYCYHPFQNQKIRQYSARRVVDEVKFLQQDYGIKSVIFADDLFILNKNRVFEICDLLDREKVRIKWATSARVNTVDEELLVRIKKAGCVSLGFGVESGSPAILKNIKKYATPEQALNAIRLCRKVGIEPNCSFMINNIGETRETVFETVEFVKKAEIPPIDFFFATPYPGTELYDYALDKGLIRDEKKLIESYGEQGEQILVNFTGMSNDELTALKREAKEAILNNYRSIRPSGYLVRIIDKLLFFPRVFMKELKIGGFRKTMKKLSGFVKKRIHIK